jgi:ABC-type lipoprotein export system ATPase subunit
MNTVGSVWKKWDLHIHTPASFHWKGKRFQDQTHTERDQACKDIIDRINELDVAAFCIMDYWTFEGYLTLREYIVRNPGVTSKRIFPGMEFRLEAPTDYRLNAHVLLNDELDSETLRAFVMHLKLSGPNGKPPTRPNFIELGRRYDDGKLKLHGFKAEDKADEHKMHQLGRMTAEISRDSLKEAISQVGDENCLFILPYDTSDGVEDLEWKCHPYADSTLMRWADCFEAREQTKVDLFLGFGHPTKPQIGTDFINNLGGYPKPVFSGSDAHEISKYGVYPSNRVTWLKAQPTFKGLRQVCHEPALRCHIGERPAKLHHLDQNPTKYIRTLKLDKVNGSSLDEHWFTGKEILLNPGLIAIIGNKGSGKSALADILALAGNSHCSSMEFLNDDRFRGAGNKAKHFTATITWADGTDLNVNLGQDADLQQPERIRYLPQHFIEDLCNEIATGNETKFGKELRKVIFSHVPDEKQLGMGTLDELLDYIIEARRQAFAQIQQTLYSLNETIVRNEQEMSEDTLKSYQTSLALKQSELDAFDKTPIDVVEKPKEDEKDEATKETVRQIDLKRTEIISIKTQIDQAKKERLEAIAEQATLKRLGGHVLNFEESYKTFVAERSEEFEEAGFKLTDIVSVTVNQTPLVEAVAANSGRLNAIQELIEGKIATGDEPAILGLEAISKQLEESITKLQQGLDAPQKAYQAYLKEVEARNARRALIIGAAEKVDTIEYYKDRIKRATEVLPIELAAFVEERRSIVRKLHTEILAMRAAYEELYAPVQKIASEAATATNSIQLEFDASVATTSFESNFLDFIHRGRKGSFYGEDESRAAIRGLLKSHNFNNTESVIAFTDAVLKALSEVERDGDKEAVQISSQLRDKKKLTELYDFLFGLDYLDIRYNLRLGGKDISQLSPGEKGALLLVFYLLLDKEEIPIIIDQPEHNLDNESVVRLLVECIRKARARRQVMIVTHNPNLAVYCDADQIVCCQIDKLDGHKIEYSTGAIEDYDINQFAVKVLEGTYPAFDNRRKKWHKPLA